MRTSPRRLMSYASFLVLLVVDAVALVALVLVQLLGVPMPAAWLLAGLLVTVAAPALLRVADRLFAAAADRRTVPQAGESFL